ncbi:MAG TPA: ABC transporter permease, partial [Armatimonadota bacterium]|nr:ABC transporter permease [Armatimonadota bacterium]
MEKGRKLPPIVQALLRGLRVWLIPVLLCAGFSLHPGFARTFWTADYLPNIAQQSATNIILATGLTFVILTGGIDLSVGSVIALCAVLAGTVMTETGLPVAAGIL